MSTSYKFKTFSKDSGSLSCGSVPVQEGDILVVNGEAPRLVTYVMGKPSNGTVSAVCKKELQPEGYLRKGFPMEREVEVELFTSRDDLPKDVQAKGPVRFTREMLLAAVNAKKSA
jgi:hypothetical protein